jgi:hypothetical protein
MAGMAVTTVMLASFWAAAALVLLAQDGTPPAEVLRELKAFQQNHPVQERVFARGIREYVRRSFHPSDNDNAGLAASYLASARMA